MPLLSELFGCQYTTSLFADCAFQRGGSFWISRMSLPELRMFLRLLVLRGLTEQYEYIVYRTKRAIEFKTIHGDL